MTGLGAREPDQVDESVFSLSRFGLRFSRPATEVDYRAWNLLTAVPYLRRRLVSGVFNWMVFLVLYRLGGDDSFPRMAAWTLLLMVPVQLGCIAITYRPRLVRWTFPSVMGANLASGFLLTAVCHRFLAMPELATAVVAASGLIAFTLFRLRPLQAAVVVIPYFALNERILAGLYAAGQLSRTQLFVHAAAPAIILVVGLIACAGLDRANREIFRAQTIMERQRAIIERERVRADELLFSILPAPLAERLKRSPALIADSFAEVTVLFADLVGFTPLAARVEPSELVAILNEIFTRFDELAAHHGVEKIKTIGDAYMAAAGLPEPRADHAEAAAALALDMRDAVAAYSARTQQQIRVRIGLSTGPVVAGVIGARKFAYDLWGDTVNTAARMESHGLPGEIQISEATFLALGERFRYHDRGMIDVKGKGPMHAWLLARPSPAGS